MNAPDYYREYSIRYHIPTPQFEFECKLTTAQLQHAISNVVRMNQQLNAGQQPYHIHQIQQYGRHRIWLEGTAGPWR
jgi:hypothetical protein